MKDALVLARENAIVIIDWIVLLVIVTGTLEATASALLAARGSRARSAARPPRRDGDDP